MDSLAKFRNSENPLEDTVIAAVKTENENKNVIRELPITLEEIRRMTTSY